MCVIKKSNMVNQKEKICYQCKKPISAREKLVLLGTYVNKKILEECFFHFDCYRYFINSTINKGMKNRLENLGERVNKMAGSIGKMFEGMNIKGIDLKKEYDILGFPETETQSIKKENGKRKRENRKKSQKRKSAKS